MRKMQKKQVQEKTDKVAFLSSMKFKISAMLIGGMTLTALIILLIVIPTVQGIIKDQTKSYLFDVITGNGAVLDSYDTIDPSDYDDLEELFKNVGIDGVESSYAYVVTFGGNYVYHPEQEKIGKPVENEMVQGILKELRKGNHPEPEIINYVEDGVNKCAAYYVTEDGFAIAVVTADEDEVMKPVKRILLISIVAFLIIIVVMSIFALIITGILVNPIVKVSEIVKKMAQMDFTYDERDNKLLERKDETGLMSRSVATFRREMVQMIERLQKQSEELFEASKRLERDASQTAQTVEQVGCAVDDIASGAGNQAEETQNATEHIVIMGQKIEETNEEAEILEENSQQMKDSSNQASSILEQLMDVNERTKESINEIYEQTSITNVSAEKIKEAISIISAIADETNLLSLNASIEAARAGEQGRGFAVVATQIQNLAEQSNNSAKTIDEITNDLIKNSTKAVEIMGSVRTVMDEQSKKMQQTDEMFKQVNSGVENALRGVVNITDKTEHLNQSRKMVVDVVQNLSAIAQENAASSQETSAAVTEVSNIVSDISENASELKVIAAQLEESVKCFKL